MSNYTVTTNFANKDALPSGSSDKVIKGVEFTAEFNNIATAVNSKADSTQVLTNVPSGALFTDTVYTKPASEPISYITGLQTALDGKVSNTGDSLSGIYNYADLSELRFGDGADLRIFHNGTNSYIQDAGTGDLVIKGANVKIVSSETESMARFVENGESILYHNNVEKLTTTVDGIDVTGLSINGVELLGTPWNVNTGSISIYTDETWGGIYVFDNNASNGAHYIRIDHTTSFDNSYYTQFSYQGVTAGSISRSGTTGVSYNTSSDYRLKENVVPVENAADRVKALKPCRFNFIGEERVVDGFIAHEAKQVVPESVTGAKDAVDVEGNPVYQGIDQSKLVPLLTAALQEAIARIEVLEGVA